MRSVDYCVEIQEREKVIKIAREYLRTPYRERGRVKGVGVDCLTFVVGVYEDSGFITKRELPKYNPRWHLHRSEELYKNGILTEFHQVSNPMPGDIALYKLGRCFCHAVVICSWPHEVIHAFFNRNVMQTDASIDGTLRGRLHEFYSLWE